MDKGIEIKDSDLLVNYFRTSNRVDAKATGVRLLHKPSNVMVSAGGERSVNKNLAKAMAALRAKLVEAGVIDDPAETLPYIPNFRRGDLVEVVSIPDWVIPIAPGSRGVVFEEAGFHEPNTGPMVRFFDGSCCNVYENWVKAI